MTDLNITDESIPDLNGKHAVVTGGASGIGLACCQLLVARGAAQVHMLDMQAAAADLPSNVTYHACDVSDWEQLQTTFASFSRVDLVFVNAGRGQGGDPFNLAPDPSTGKLQEPCRAIIDTNFRGALNTAVLGVRAMRAHGSGGSIVFTASAAGISFERGLPVYGSLKLALVGLVRGWRNQLLASDNITVNAVAPACTITGLMPAHIANALGERGLQVSPPEHVARALVYAAVGTEDCRVEAYGAEREDDLKTAGRWNGRVILTMGDRYTELEEPLERLKPQWFGERNWADTRHGQIVTEGMFKR